jgi:hypothetical protein
VPPQPARQVRAVAVEDGPTGKLSPSSEVSNRRWHQDCRKERGPRRDTSVAIGHRHFPSSEELTDAAIDRTLADGSRQAEAGEDADPWSGRCRWREALRIRSSPTRSVPALHGPVGGMLQMHSPEVRPTRNVRKGEAWFVIIASRRNPCSLRQSWRQPPLPTSELGDKFRAGPLPGATARTSRAVCGGTAADLTRRSVCSDGNAVHHNRARPHFRGSCAYLEVFPPEAVLALLTTQRRP